MNGYPVGLGKPRFATVVFDIDSTLSGIEGIDWLAERRDRETSEWALQLTDDAMSGRIPLEDAYARRLEAIAPSHEEVEALAEAYRGSVAPGAAVAIAELRRNGVRVLAVSGGLRQAVLPLCRGLGIAEQDVFAVPIHWDAHGRFAGFDRASPLATQHGKVAVVAAASVVRPVLAVGDGSTDAAMRASGAADAFAAFVGFVRRPNVVADADHIVSTLDDVVALVLPPALRVRRVPAPPGRSSP